MYAEFYGLCELPFNITPDPRFLYLNDCYQEALAALTYGIDARKGFISLIGEAGTGKTTLLRRLLDTLDPRTKTVLLLNPTVSFAEILEHILIELGIPTDGGGKLVLLQRLNEFLLEHTASGGNVVLLIDEAQDLHTAALEELRLLSNLETAREKILQIVLAGQPELEAILRDPALRQLRQRVTLNIRVRPLTPAEVRGYVRTRLEHAGATDLDVLTPGALARVGALSRGIPRLVNVLCDASLLMGFVTGTRPVTPAIVDAAWNDYNLDPAAAEAPDAPAAVVAPAVEPAPPPVIAIVPATPAPTPAPEEPAPVLAQASEPAPPPDVLPPDASPPVAAAPAEEPAPAPGRGHLPAAPPPPTFSVPAAAAFVGALVLGIYALSIQNDPAEQPIPMAGVSRPAAEDALPPGTGTAVAATPPAPVAVAPRIEVVRADGAPISAAEATALVDRFRTAYEMRDVERVVGLFAPDATENGRQGLEQIAASYRTAFGNFAEVHYTVPSLAVAAGTHATVRAPFAISYRQTNGSLGEVKGDAEWELERRDGLVRIVNLSYRLGPTS